MVRATLRNLRRHLAPGGTLAFETRNPLVEEWRDWIPDKTHEVVQVPGIGRVTTHNDIAAAEGERVTYETHYRFGPDDVVVASDTIRFMDQGTLAALLREVGFTDVTWYGDWDRSAIGASSPEIIVIARH